MVQSNINLSKEIIESGIGDCCTAAAVAVVKGDEVVFEHVAGVLNPELGSTPVTEDTLFDLASLTKLFTTTVFLRLVEDEFVGLDEPVSSILSEFSGTREIAPFENPLAPGRYIEVSSGGTVDARDVTFRHLLTHTSGLPGWKPLYKLGSPEKIRDAVFHTDFAYLPGTNVVYSDLGFMVLGWTIEKLTGMSLNLAVSRYLTAPYQLASITYGPVPAGAAAATEYCPWRGRRMQGEVHDENAWVLGGVSGHAGLFGNVKDVAEFGRLWLHSVLGDSVLIESHLAQEAVSLQAEKGTTRRGLGWALWSPAETSPSNPFGPNTFGHTGFTGTSLYIDPDRELIVVALTNRVFYGRDARKIRDFRLKLHRAAVDLVG